MRSAARPGTCRLKISLSRERHPIDIPSTCGGRTRNVLQLIWPISLLLDRATECTRYIHTWKKKIYVRVVHPNLGINGILHVLSGYTERLGTS